MLRADWCFFWELPRVCPLRIYKVDPFLPSSLCFRVIFVKKRNFVKSFIAFLVGIVATCRQNASQRHFDDGVPSSCPQSTWSMWVKGKSLFVYSFFNFLLFDLLIGHSHILLLWILSRLFRFSSWLTFIASLKFYLRLCLILTPFRYFDLGNWLVVFLVWSAYTHAILT